MLYSGHLPLCTKVVWPLSTQDFPLPLEGALIGLRVVKESDVSSYFSPPEEQTILSHSAAHLRGRVSEHDVRFRREKEASTRLIKRLSHP